MLNNKVGFNAKYYLYEIYISIKKKQKPEK